MAKSLVAATFEIHTVDPVDEDELAYPDCLTLTLKNGADVVVDFDSTSGWDPDDIEPNVYYAYAEDPMDDDGLAEIVADPTMIKGVASVTGIFDDEDVEYAYEVTEVTLRFIGEVPDDGRCDDRETADGFEMAIPCKFVYVNL